MWGLCTVNLRMTSEDILNGEVKSMWSSLKIWAWEMIVQDMSDLSFSYRIWMSKRFKGLVFSLFMEHCPGKHSLIFWLSNFHAVYQDLSCITHPEIKVGFAHCTMVNFASIIKKITNIWNQYLISTVCNTGINRQHLLVKNKLLNTKRFIILLSSSSFCLLLS